MPKKYMKKAEIIVEIKTKILNFEIEWEVVSVNGKVGLLLKDILKYFGYSNSSQGTVIDQVHERNRVMLSGGEVRAFKHMQKRATIIFRKGLVDFTKSKVGTTKYKLGRSLIDWFDATVIPTMKEETISQVYVEKPAKKEPDLFDIAKEEEIQALKKVAHLQNERISTLEKRVEELEKRLKENAFGQVIHAEGEKKLIDADALISLLRSTDVNGKLR